MEFCDECYTIYLHTKNNHIQAKKKYQKNLYRFKMNPKYPIFNRFTPFRFGKNFIFPKEVFNEIWLIREDLQSIYIAKVKIWSFYSGGILEAKHFPAPPNANVC